MKGAVVFCTFLFVGSPLLATVTISVVPGADPLTVDIIVSADGDDLDARGNSKVAGLALDVSVDSGVIEDVYNYKTTGESVVGDKGYGIFPSSISFVDPYPRPMEIADTGTPVAEGLGTSSIVLELGGLYDQGIPDAAPEMTTILCTLKVSEKALVDIQANAARGGVVLIGGAAPSSVVFNTGIIIEPPACWENLSASDQVEYWKYINTCGFTHEQMACWCTPYHCAGDAAVDKHVLGYRVYVTDLNCIAKSWRAKFCDPNLDPCCDVAHDGHPLLKYRVYTSDLAIIAANWRKKDADLEGDCNVSR